MIKIACAPAPGLAAELASQRPAMADKSALRRPTLRQDGPAPEQATPAGKRALHSTSNHLREVCRAGKATVVLPPSKIPQSSRPPTPPSQAMGMPTSVSRGGKAGASRQPLDSALGSPGQRLPHLKAAMLGANLRTNVLMDSGGSTAISLSMQGSRVAMRRIGDAQRKASSHERPRSVASSRNTSGDAQGPQTNLHCPLHRRYLACASQMP